MILRHRIIDYHPVVGLDIHPDSFLPIGVVFIYKENKYIVSDEEITGTCNGCAFAPVGDCSKLGIPSCVCHKRLDKKDIIFKEL